MRVKCIFLSFIVFMCSMIHGIGVEPLHVNHAIKLRANYVRKMAKEKKLILFGFGGALFNDIEEITIHYISVQKVNLGEARKLYIECAEELINMMNDYREMRPYLHNFPATISNTDLTILFQDKKLGNYTDGSVAFVFYTRGKIFYRASSDTQNFIPLHEETYEEALKIYRESL